MTTSEKVIRDGHFLHIMRFTVQFMLRQNLTEIVHQHMSYKVSVSMALIRLGPKSLSINPSIEY